MSNIYDEYVKIPGYIDDEAYNSRIKAQRFWQRKRIAWIIENALEIENKKSKTGLDIGCGSGVITRFISRYFKNFIGVDISRNAIDHCNKMKGENEEYICSNAERIPIEDESIDLVICSELIEHIKEYDRMLDEIYRVLKKEGVLLLTTPNFSSLWPLVEYLWDNLWAGRGYGKQHISKFNPLKLRGIIKDKFKIVDIETMFLYSPFVAIVSEGLADFTYGVERKYLPRSNFNMLIFMKTIK